MRDVFEVTKFLSLQEVQSIIDIASNWEEIPFTPNYGRWPGELIAIQRWHKWDEQDSLGHLLGKKLRTILGNNIKVVEVDFQQLFLPWDIHADLSRDIKGSQPWYTVVIPLDNYNSRTIIFDQISPGYNDFYRYKQEHSVVENPVDINFWNDNLSHCWDEDRQYLSLKYVSHNWSAGDAICFKRELIHSSDNYHTRGVGSKTFLQILVDLS